jgi:hypothetical protein
VFSLPSASAQIWVSYGSGAVQVRGEDDFSAETDQALETNQRSLERILEQNLG